MSLSVCFLLDPHGEHAVRSLWSRLEAHGVPSLATHTHGRHHPHVSYAVLLRWDLQDVQDALAALPDRGPFPVVFQGMVAFPRGRACLAPSLPAAVVARQEAVSTALAATGALVHHHYEPGRWVPHCSLSPRATGAALPVVARAVSDVLPLTVRATRFALVDSSTGQTWELPTAP
jgi:hypothetical protein